MRNLIILVLVLPLTYCSVTVGVAQYRAADICSSIPEHATVSEVEQIVSNAGVPELKPHHATLHQMISEPNWSKSQDGLFVVIPSILGERYVCSVRFDQGHVSEKEVRLID